MTVHVQCPSCGAWGITDNHAFPDHAVTCVSPAGSPEGSVEGSCCTAGRTHSEHLEWAELNQDSACRPVIITVMGAAPPGGGGGSWGIAPLPPDPEEASRALPPEVLAAAARLAGTAG